MERGWSRREILEVIGALGLGAFACGPRPTALELEPETEDPKYRERIEPVRYSSNLAALLDRLLPVERDANGAVTSPGALEVGAERTLGLANFVVLAEAQGLVPPLSDEWLKDRSGFDLALQRLLDIELDVLAATQRPLLRFFELPIAAMDAAITEGFEDQGLRPVLLFARAACFVAWLGAVTSDAGLVAVGFPPFEDFASGLAVSGYPRMLPSGEVDDYTFNRAPQPTSGDDLSLVIDANGDLV